MVVYASSTPAPPTDGVAYALKATVPAIEGDVYNGAFPFDPVSVGWAQSLVASVELAVVGTLLTNSTYIVLQGDNGDGVWFDLAWIGPWTALVGTANWIFSCGAFQGNVVQQTRAAGTAPASNGSIQVPLPGRWRFVGKSSVTGTPAGSSPAAGAGPAVQVSIQVKLLGLR